jgi:hypothetical protein
VVNGEVVDGKSKPIIVHGEKKAAAAGA